MTIHVERYEIDPDHQEMLSTVLVAIEQDIVEKTGAPEMLARMSVAKMISSMADSIREKAMVAAFEAVAAMKGEIKLDG
jgi:hypothetical protein